MRISVLATTLASGAFLIWMVSFGSAHSLYADDGRAAPAERAGAVATAEAGAAARTALTREDVPPSVTG